MTNERSYNNFNTVKIESLTLSGYRKVKSQMQRKTQLMVLNDNKFHYSVKFHTSTTNLETWNSKNHKLLEAFKVRLIS